VSYYIQIGASGPEEISSNTGYGDFGRWVETLDPVKFPEPIHLYLYGWSQNLEDLRKQILAATRTVSTPAPVADVVRTIAGLLSSAHAESCTITDGIGPNP